ncbi:MAG: HNH endonuclease [Solirubrobacteraceae bacterium]
MLREVKGAAFACRWTPLGRRWFVVEGDRAGSVTWRRRAFAALQAEQAMRPAGLFARGTRTYWLFEGRVYWEDEELDSADVLALVRYHERRARRRLERAHGALAGEGASRRRPVPRELRQAVFARDGGRCAECGAAFDLQYDHVIPLALGGADTVENLQLLCAPCNQAKGAALG